MPRPSWLPLLACAALFTNSCDSGRQPVGECRGAYGARSVVWPIRLNSVMGSYHHFDGTRGVTLDLDYMPEDAPELAGFGVSIQIPGEPLVTPGAPWTVKLLRQGDELVSEDPSRVREWGAHTGRGSYGYPAVSGVPVEALLTVERMVHGDDGFAQGHFVYRYEDGGELKCTFDIGDRLYDSGGGGEGGGCGGGVDWDDDDDDD
jgi:hypothetical protein